MPDRRVIRHRLRPGSAARAIYLARVAGTARQVWNERVALNEKLREKGESIVSGHSDMCAWVSQFRNNPPPEWEYLKECPIVCIRRVMHDLANAYAQARRSDEILRKRGWDGRDSTRDQAAKSARKKGDIIRGWPRKKRRGQGDDGFWIAQSLALENGRIRIPRPRGEKSMWLKLRRRGSRPGENRRKPYDGCRATMARIRREKGKWFCYVWLDAPKTEPEYKTDAVIGVDRNCGMAGLSAPIVFAGRETQTPNMPTERMAKLERRRKKYQRKMARKRETALLRAHGWDGNPKTRRQEAEELRADQKAQQAAESKLGKKTAARVRTWKKILYDGRHAGMALSIARRALEREGKTPDERGVRQKLLRLAETRMMKYGRRYEIARARMGKASAKLARVRENWAHHLSRALADSARFVAIENLKIPNMTRAAKGSAEKPGTNVRAKAGLNRSILNSGWGKLARNLEYKAAETEKVPAADTSKTCSVCGRKKADLKLSARRWQCAGCGAVHHRDINAGINIAGRAAEAVFAKRARGLGADKAREAAPPILAVRPDHPDGVRAETRTKTFA